MGFFFFKQRKKMCIKYNCDINIQYDVKDGKKCQNLSRLVFRKAR